MNTCDVNGDRDVLNSFNADLQFKGPAKTLTISDYHLENEESKTKIEAQVLELFRLQKVGTRYSVFAAQQLGILLNEIKSNTKHGRFREWVLSLKLFSFRSAQRYMKLARCIGDDFFELSEESANKSISWILKQFENKQKLDSSRGSIPESSPPIIKRRLSSALRILSKVNVELGQDIPRAETPTLQEVEGEITELIRQIFEVVDGIHRTLSPSFPDAESNFHSEALTPASLGPEPALFNPTFPLGESRQDHSSVPSLDRQRIRGRHGPQKRQRVIERTNRVNR